MCPGDTFLKFIFARDPCGSVADPLTSRAPRYDLT
jgi:hypothetical protein